MGAFVTLMVIIAIPVAPAVAFARRGRWMWASAVLAVFAIPYQLLGLTSTCTQGADGSFLTGAFLSAPLLIIAVCTCIWALYRRPINLYASWVVLLAPLVLLYLTQDSWLDIFRYGTPCGELYAEFGSKPLAIMIILAAYLLLPLLLVIGAAGALMMAWKSPAVPTK